MSVLLDVIDLVDGVVGGVLLLLGFVVCLVAFVVWCCGREWWSRSDSGVVLVVLSGW